MNALRRLDSESGVSVHRSTTTVPQELMAVGVASPAVGHDSAANGGGSREEGAAPAEEGALGMRVDGNGVAAPVDGAPAAAEIAVEGDEAEEEADEEEEEEKWLGQYSSTQSILLVGDGDFSFSLALATGFGSGANHVARHLRFVRFRSSVPRKGDCWALVVIRRCPFRPFVHWIRKHMGLIRRFGCGIGYTCI